MNSSLKHLGFSIALLALAGCGGGGGGGGGATNVPPPSGEITITPENARDIAGDVFESIQDTSSLGDFGVGGLIGSTGAAGPTLSKASATIAAKSGIAGSAETGGLIAVEFGPEQSSCAVSGSVIVSGDLQNPEMLSAGDTISMSFNACDDGDGQVVNGGLSLIIDTFTGDMLTEFFALGVTVNFNSFSVREDTETTSVAGRFSMLFDRTGYPVTVATLSSPGLSVTEGAESINISNYTTTVTVDESSQPAAFSLTSSGRVDLPTQGGSVTYTVREPFTGFGEGNPESGVLFIRGANAGSVMMTVLSADQVRLEMDYDGNGTVDETAIVTWAELDD